MELQQKIRMMLLPSYGGWCEFAYEYQERGVRRGEGGGRVTDELNNPKYVRGTCLTLPN